MESFLRELKKLMQKHGAEIAFNSRGMDTHGSGDSGLEFTLPSGEVKRFPYMWSLLASDLKE